MKRLLRGSMNTRLSTPQKGNRDGTRQSDLRYLPQANELAIPLPFVQSSRLHEMRLRLPHETETDKERKKVMHESPFKTTGSFERDAIMRSKKRKVDAMDDKAKCEICGEPMPPGEQMFKFHGYSGPCPKPPLPPKSQPRPAWIDAAAKECAARVLVGEGERAFAEIIERHAKDR